MGAEILQLGRVGTVKDMQDASYSLVDSNLRIVENFIKTVEKIYPDWDNSAYRRKIRYALGAHHLTNKNKDRWITTEEWVYHFLRSLKAVAYPTTLDMRLSEYLPEIPQFYYTSEALDFLCKKRERFNYLLNWENHHEGDTLKLAVYSYVESRILRRMAYGGIYFVPQKAVLFGET